MKIAVVVPVRNGGDEFRVCLRALLASVRLPDEIIVVDDGSTDESARLAGSLGARVVSLEGGTASGPAFGRNRGAEVAQADLLVFIDADIAVHANTLGKIEQQFQEHPEIAALFGSYDADPPHRGLVSLYKNLQHHFVHQKGKIEASTFWTGIGAVRKEVFLQLGGFDERYRRPSIEDIELGLRLRRKGYRVWLCPEIQATHLKRWTFGSLLRSDIFDRAIPWVRLIFSSKELPSDLNLDQRSRVSALLAWSLVGLLIIGIKWPAGWLFAGILIVILAGLNFGLYRLFYKKAGLLFAIGAFGLHVLYFLYSSFTFGVAVTGLIMERTIKSVGLDRKSVDKVGN